MLPDFFAVVEVVFCWGFCKKRGAGCGFKRGKRGQFVVKCVAHSAGRCTVFGAIGWERPGLYFRECLGWRGRLVSVATGAEALYRIGSGAAPSRGDDVLQPVRGGDQTGG